MIVKVTDQVDTYEQTVQFVEPDKWPSWVKAIHYALLTGHKGGLFALPQVESAYNVLKAKVINHTSKADSR